MKAKVIWQVICPEHGVLSSHPTKVEAQAHLREQRKAGCNGCWLAKENAPICEGHAKIRSFVDLLSPRFEAMDRKIKREG